MRRAVRNRPWLFVAVMGIVLILLYGGGTGYGEDRASGKGGTGQAAIKESAVEKGVNLDVSDLPLYEVPQGETSTDMLGLFISGDGGWWTLDSTVSKVLAGHGVPIIGLSSHKYFATTRTPDGTSQDMARALRYYLAKWHKERVVLIGYSLGAEIIPFVATRLPEDLGKRLVMVAMIGPSANTVFEFHVTDWVVTPAKRVTYPVRPEIEKITGVKVLCLYGEKDKTCICSQLDPTRVICVERPGDHHFAGDYPPLAEAIWKELSSAGGAAGPGKLLQ